MKKEIFTGLLAGWTALMAQAAEPEWVLAGETRKPYLNCNQPKGNGLSLNWTQPAVRGRQPQGIESEGEIDGRVLFEGDTYQSVLEWTKPIIDHRIGKLVMHLSASDMRKRSTIRIGTEIRFRGGSARYGGQYWVYASPSYKPSPVGALISSVVNQGYIQDFDLKVLVTNGGGCYDGPVTYHFRRVR